MKYALIVILFVFGVGECGAFNDWEDVYERYIDIMGDDAADNEDVYNSLYEIYLNPIDINKADRNDLEQLPFLSDSQIEAICAYLFFYDGMESLGELVLIEQLDYYTRRLLAEFIYIGERDREAFPSMRRILKYGRSDVLTTVKVPLYDRAGDRKGYLGEKYKHSLRYNFKYGNYLRAGFVAAQDAGEPFFAGDNGKGYDYYSYFIQVRDLGPVKSMALGKYRLSFGMGLVMNNNFMLGKTACTSLAGRVSNNITVHSSCYDGRSLQGAAATVNVAKNIDVTGFISYKSLDATLDKSGMIRSISTSGYHRTRTEMDKRNNTREFVTGGSVLWSAGGFHVGVSGYWARYNRPFAKPEKDSYRMYGPEGYDFYNIGVNYGYNAHRFSISGETATGKCGAPATINSISYRLTDRLSLKAIYRFYSYRYFSLFSQGFSDGGHIQNENGLYLGADYRITPYLNASFYTDLSYSPFKKYSVSKSSYSSDNMINLNYSRNSFTIGFRHRYRNREKNLKGGAGVAHRHENTTRIDCGYEHGKNFVKLQWNSSLSNHDNRSFGWMVSGYGGIGIGEKLKANGLIGYFSTDDYYSRIYIYERGPLYGFSFPCFYGRGFRVSAMCRYDIGSNYMLTMRFGHTKYFNKSEIGSGLQKISHSYVSDIDIQLRIKF